MPKVIIYFWKDSMTLLETRKGYGLSQVATATLLNIPLRTYIRYESDDSYGDALKRQMMINTLNDACEITEEKGILGIGFIKSTVSELFDKKYKGQIEFCYIFGSYAKGYAKETSDIDLCVSTDITGLDFLGLVEDLRTSLHKKIDLIRLKDIKNSNPLLSEIMKDGIKIYG